MCPNPALARELAGNRVADLQSAAGPGARDRGQLPRARDSRAVRRAAGWLLVDLGLRLALPRRVTTAPTARPVGHR